MSGPRGWLPALLVALCAALPLLPTLGNGLLYDDEVLLGVVRPSFGELWTSDLFGIDEHGHPASGYYRPVVRLSYWLESKLHGGRPAWFHATSVLIHVANSLLLLAVLRRIRAVAPYALAAALLFAVHPIHSESVCVVTGRTDPMGLLFFLLAVFGAMKGRLLVALSMFFLAQLSKESVAALLPFLVAAPFAGSLSPSAKRSAGRLLAGGLVIVAGFFWFKVAHLGIVPPDDVYTGEGTVGERFLTFIAALPKYLGLMLWPERLSITHRFDLVTGPLDPRLWLGFGVCVVLAAMALFGRAPLWLSAAFFLLPLAPASNLVPITYAFEDMPFPLFERYLYIPSIGVCLFAAVLLHEVAARVAPRRSMAAAVTAAALLLCVPLGVRQWVRAGDFKSSATLYASAMRDGLAADEVLLGRAGALFREGKPVESLAAYDEFLRLHPDSVDGRLERASVRLELAEQYRRHALAHGQTGQVELERQGLAQVDALLADAKADIEAVAEQRDNGWAEELLGALAGIRGDFFEAARHYLRAYHLGDTSPTFAENFRYVAWKVREPALEAVQKGSAGTKQGIYLYERGLRALTGTVPPEEIAPPIREIVIKMMCEHADAMVLAGKAVQAASAYRWVLSHEPKTARAHVGLGYLAKQSGDRSAAYLELKQALSIDPDAPVALMEMVNMLMEDKQTEEASELFRRLLRLYEEQGIRPETGARPDAEGR